MKNTEYHCPECGAVIPLDDINVAKDMALCRACSGSFPWSGMVQERKWDDALSQIPKYLTISETPGGVLLTYRKVKIIPALILIVFSVFWNKILAVPLVRGIAAMWSGENGVVQFHFNPEIFVLVPFLLVGLVVFMAALLFLFGKTTLELDNGKGVLFRGIGNIGRRWRFLLKKGYGVEVRRVGEYSRHPVEEVAVSQPDGSEFSFGSGMDGEVREYVKVFLQKWRC